MRTLLLLRGTPGSGKSTFIKENGLERYTLEADMFRQHLNNPQLTEDFQMLNTLKDDGQAWTNLFTALEHRMKNGEFTVVDATHANPTHMQRYKALVEKYRYSVFYYDMKTDVEEVKQRNKTRVSYDSVPDDQIDRIQALLEHTKPKAFAREVKDVKDILNYYVDDLNSYEKVLLVGDIQGCYTALDQLMSQYDMSTTAFVFIGDLIDRGIENKEVVDFFVKHMDDKNFYLIEGNHDGYLRCWAENSWDVKNGKLHKPRQFANYTEKELEAHPLLEKIDEPATKRRYNEYLENYKKDVRQLARKFRQAYAFTFGTHKIFACHGGISYLPEMTKIPTNQLIRGVGDYTTEIDEIWEKAYEKGLTQGFTQVHGHRHSQSTEHSICLEDNVERGGHLVALELTKDDSKIVKVKNDVFLIREDKWSRHEESKTEETENEIVNEMLKSRFIKAKQLEKHNLMSLNFTSAAFKKGRWNRQTIQARGLFVDRTTGDVKMRSYNKFFNLHEMNSTKPKQLEKTLKFPIYAYKKENGFLGIASTINDEFTLASKSQTDGPFVDYFKEVFDTLTTQEKDKLKELSKKYNCSFVFEVLHTEDKHMIDFKRNQLILLDAVENSFELNGVTVDKDFSEKVKNEVIFQSPHFTQKELVATFNSLDELLAYADEHTNDRHSEGLVIEDQNGFMFKVKYDYYTSLKKLRAVFHHVRSHIHQGISYGRFKSPFEIKFATWLFKNKSANELKRGHIINLFNEFEKVYGKSL